MTMLVTSCVFFILLHVSICTADGTTAVPTTVPTAVPTCPTCQANAECISGETGCQCKTGFIPHVDGTGNCVVDGPVFDSETCRSRTAVADANVHTTKVDYLPVARNSGGMMISNVACTPASGGQYTIGDHDITCTATDTAGKTAECMFNLTITDLDECNPESPCVNAGCSLITDGRYFCNCSTGFSKTNMDTCTDLDPPVFDDTPCKSTVTKTAPPGSVMATVTWTDPMASDSTGGSTIVECTPRSASSNFGLTDTTVTCTAKDAAENYAAQNCTFTVRVTDYDECNPSATFTHSCVNAVCENTAGNYRCNCKAGYSEVSMDDRMCVDLDPPVFDDPLCQSTVTETAPPGSVMATVTWTDPMASDSTGGSTIVECTPRSGSSNFGLIDTTVTCTARDAAGNPAAQSCIFTVRVTDFDECVNGGNNCDGNADCFNLAGSFECTCRPGFSGDDGTSCTACVDGKYGQDCASSCPCILLATCNKVTGACTCSAPFQNAVCDKNDLEVELSADEQFLDTAVVDNATLTCRVNLPSQDLEMPVTITYPNGSVFSATRTEEGVYEVTIIDLSVNDTGNYTCNATTQFGQTTIQKSGYFEVDVITPGRIISLTPEAKQKLGGSVTLECVVFLRPTPNITWYNQYGVKVVPIDSRYAIVEGPQLGRYQSFLTVTNLIRSDNGFYTCETSNNITDDIDRKDARIIVTEIPEVGQVTAKALSSKVIEVEWKITYYGNLLVDMCKVDYKESGQWVNAPFESVPPLRKEITNRKPFTVYTVRVICKNGDGRSVPPYPEASVRTLQDEPSEPLTVRVTDVYSRELTVNWDQPLMPKGTIAYYQVSIMPNGGTTPQTERTPVNSGRMSLGVTGLKPFTSYTIFVIAVNIEGGEPLEGTESDTILQRTNEAEPSEPVNVTLDGEGTMCTVTWDPPLEKNGIITSYMIYFLPYKFQESGSSPDKDPSKSSFEWQYTDVARRNFSVNKTELSHYAKYRIQVLATTSPGKGERSMETETTCDTPKAAPMMIPMPMGVQTTINGEPAITSSSFVMNIEPADTTNGTISCYDIVVIQLPDDKDIIGKTPASFGEFVTYVQAHNTPGMPYIAISRNGMNLTANEDVIIGNKTPTSCNPSSRKRREVVDTSYHKGDNGELDSGKWYTAYVRACVIRAILDDEMELCSSSPLLTPVMTSSKVNGPAIAIGIILALLIVVVVVLVMLIYVRRRKQMPLLLHSGENGMALEAVKTDEPEVTHMVVPSIPLEDLPAKFKVKSENDDEIFKTEYKSIPESTGTVTKFASREECNKEKNRYINIVAFDQTRVKLTPIEGEEGSDYINACYVDGYEGPRKFIAAQGPRDDTVLDFWRMIWEQNCSTLIMLTKCIENGREKCAEYWPEEDAIMYGDIIVTLDDVVTCADYLIRKFTVQKSIEGEDEDEEPIISETRTMMQFHFLGWPDFGIPKYPHSMLCFIKRIRHMTGNRTEPGNIIIHCSAGVGRTGTYTLIDTMLDMMKKEKRVDIYNVIYRLRSQRNLIVQSLVQFIFIHKALMEEYLYGHTEVDVGGLQSYYQKINTKKAESDVTGIETEYRTVASLPVEDTDQKTGNIEANKQKNRLRQVIPYDKNRVKLERLTGQEHSNYINASFIDGYEHKKAYIAAQGPLPNTMGDFWRLIWENQCSTVVMLTDCEERGQTVCSKYWPSSDETVNHAFLTVSLKEEKEKTDEYTIRDLEVSTTKGAGTKLIRQYHFHDWPEVGTPEGAASLVKIIGLAHDYQSDIGRFPVLVHCSAGSGRTGVFIALSYLLQRAKAEGLVDVFQAVRTLRQQRPHMVQDVEQYQFCYRAMMEYLDSFDHYANFK